MNKRQKYQRLVFPLFLLGLSLLYPMVYIVQTSLSEHGKLSLVSYREVFASSQNLRMFANTAMIAAVVVTITLVFGYILAILLAHGSRGTKVLLSAALVYPFFTSVLVKSFAFIVILGPTGPLIKLARLLGLGHVSLLYSWTAVVIGMSYSLLPYMALTLYTSIRSVDNQVLLAARNLGAGKIRTFFSVLVPMTRSGIIGGSLLVFVLSFGYYVTPALLGGPSNTMVAMAVATQALTALNFAVASALAIGIVAVVAIMFSLYMKLAGVDALVRGSQV